MKLLSARVLAALLSALSLTLPAAAATVSIRGTAVYTAQTPPPPGAVLVVTLEDASRADAPSREIASLRMAVKSRPPYAWRMAYDPAAAQGSRHVLRASLLARGQLVMTTERAYPALESGAGKNPVLTLRPVQAAAAQTPSVPGAALQGTYWKLTQLAGQPVRPPAGQAREAHLVLQADGRVAGSDGCNRMGGSYTLEAAELKFGPLMGTKMGCPDIQGADVAFTRALAGVTAWRVSGNTLELLAGSETVARLTAVALR